MPQPALARESADFELTFLVSWNHKKHYKTMYYKANLRWQALERSNAALSPQKTNASLAMVTAKHRFTSATPT